MSFFDRPDDVWLTPQVQGYRPPAPPSGATARAIGVVRALAESPRATVTLILTRVVPDGFEFDIEVQLRRPQPDSVLDSEGDRWVPFYMDDVGALPKDDLPDYVFRLGIEYPGGGRTSTLPWTKQRHSAPVTPLLIGLHGGGLPDVYRESFWITPLPPPGAVKFVVEWPAGGVHEQGTTVPASTILSALAGSDV